MGGPTPNPVTAGTLDLSASSARHLKPLNRLERDFGDEIVVLVDVQHREPHKLSRRGKDEGRHRHCPVTSALRQQVLDL